MNITRTIAAAGAVLFFFAPALAFAADFASGQSASAPQTPAKPLTPAELRLYQQLGSGISQYSHKPEVTGFLLNNRLPFTDDGKTPATITVTIPHTPENFLVTGTLHATFKFDDNNQLVYYVVKEDMPGEKDSTATANPSGAANQAKPAGSAPAGAPNGDAAAPVPVGAGAPLAAVPAGAVNGAPSADGNTAVSPVPSAVTPPGDANAVPPADNNAPAAVNPAGAANAPMPADGYPTGVISPPDGQAH